MEGLYLDAPSPAGFSRFKTITATATGIQTSLHRTNMTFVYVVCCVCVVYELNRASERRSVMNLAVLKEAELAMPTDKESELAAETGRQLAAIINGAETVRAHFCPKGAATVELPVAAVRLLLDILEQMARGNAVTLMPVHAELTTQQAADLLNVSRTHLVQLLDEEKIPHRKVGTHRRVRAEDVLAYRRDTERARRKALDELTELDEELGLQ